MNRIHGILSLKRRLLCLGLSALACLGACRKEDPQTTADGVPEVKTLRYLGGFNGVSLAELAEDLGYLAPLKLEWKGNVLGGPEAIRALASGDVDFASAATGSVVKLLASNAPILQVISSGGVDTAAWGGFYVLEGSPIRTQRDLIGKKIGLNTLAAHSEFMAREWLSRGGLSPQEIKQITLVVIPPINSEQTLRQGSTDVATLGGIHRDKALERGGLRLLFSDHDLFGDFNSTTSVVRREFARKYPNTVHRYVSGVARAIEWSRSQPRDTVRTRLYSILKKRKRGENPELVKYWRSFGIASKGGLISDHDIQLWVDWMLKQGELTQDQLKPLSELYSNEFNPYRDPSIR